MLEATGDQYKKGGKETITSGKEILVFIIIAAAPKKNVKGPPTRKKEQAITPRMAFVKVKKIGRSLFEGDWKSVFESGGGPSNFIIRSLLEVSGRYFCCCCVSLTSLSLS